jgi:hypothetical protein
MVSAAEIAASRAVSNCSQIPIPNTAAINPAAARARHTRGAGAGGTVIDPGKEGLAMRIGHIPRKRFNPQYKRHDLGKLDIPQAISKNRSERSMFNA